MKRGEITTMFFRGKPYHRGHLAGPNGMLYSVVEAAG